MASGKKEEASETSACSSCSCELNALRGASLAAPTDCTCPDAGEVLEMTAEVDDAISAGIHEIILGIDAESFSLIEDADGTVVTVTYWY